MWSDRIKRHLGLYTALAALAGWLTGLAVEAKGLRGLIPVVLFAMLLPVMLDVEANRLREVFKKPALLLLALAVNFVLCPLLIWIVSRLALPDRPAYLQVGLILYGITPGGGMVPAFTAMAKGNVNLALAVTALSHVLGLAFVPLWTGLLVRRIVAVPLPLMVAYLALVTALPLALAVVLRRLVLNRRGRDAFKSVKTRLQAVVPFGPPTMFFIVFAMNAELIATGPDLVLRSMSAVAIFLAVVLIGTNLFVGRVSSKQADRPAFVFGSSAKNVAIAVALSAGTFGRAEALAVAAGAFVQLPMMLAYLRWAERRRKAHPPFWPPP